MYVQRDGVAMMLPVDILFANFYLGSVAEIFTWQPELKPKINERYVDDIFISTDTEKLINNFKTNSCLSSTHEIEEIKRIAFFSLEGATWKHLIQQKCTSKQPTSEWCK